MQDYRRYVLGWKEKMMCAGIALALAGLIAWLFYRSAYAVALAVPLYFPVKAEAAEYLARRRKSEMLFQFREMLQMALSAQKAGYAMENAFAHAREEFVKLYGDRAVMAREFANINHQVGLNVPLEKLLDDLARRSGIEEISSFSQVFGFAKRGGGDIGKIFRDTVDKIRQKADVKREIETVTAAKRMEMNIMNLMPFGILIYVGATSPEFLEPLYGNLAGAFVMTACLIGYACAYKIGKKIVDIRV